MVEPIYFCNSNEFIRNMRVKHQSSQLGGNYHMVSLALFTQWLSACNYFDYCLW